MTPSGTLARLREPRDLMADEAAEIRRELDLAETAFESAMAHAIRVGELLIDVKGKLPHGAWIPWLRSNWPRTVREAQNYMLVARKAKQVSHMPTLREALDSLAARKRRAKRGPPLELLEPSGASFIPGQLSLFRCPTEVERLWAEAGMPEFTQVEQPRVEVDGAFDAMGVAFRNAADRREFFELLAGHLSERDGWYWFELGPFSGCRARIMSVASCKPPRSGGSMSVIMMMRVSGDPARFEETVAAEAEAIGRIMDVAKSNGLIAHRWYGSDGSSWPSTSGPTRRASKLLWSRRSQTSGRSWRRPALPRNRT